MSWENLLKFDNSEMLRFYEDINKVINGLGELESMMETGQPYDFFKTNEMKQLSDTLGKLVALLESRPLRR